jgi:hypothetical protein
MKISHISVKDEESQMNNLKIKSLEEENIMLRSHLIKL